MVGRHPYQILRSSREIFGIPTTHITLAYISLGLISQRVCMMLPMVGFDPLPIQSRTPFDCRVAYLAIASLDFSISFQFTNGYTLFGVSERGVLYVLFVDPSSPYDVSLPHSTHSFHCGRLVYLIELIEVAYTYTPFIP